MDFADVTWVVYGRFMTSVQNFISIPMQLSFQNAIMIDPELFIISRKLIIEKSLNQGEYVSKILLDIKSIVYPKYGLVRKPK